jgi:RNA polymerase sigma-70 factor (ECF subfamily)
VVDSAVAAAVAEAHRAEWAFVLAATVRVTADLDLAEECTQAAFTKALTEWEVTGVPARPGAWLTTTSRNLAYDQLRRARVLREKLPLLVEDDEPPQFAYGRGEAIEDDRLRLIFTCCHPALSTEAQLALTLRFVCGLKVPEIARAFLVSEATMAARVTRAKKKIAVARIPYRTPTAAELPERLSSVLQVVYLVFTTGHTAPTGDELLRDDLVQRALGLARTLRELLPGDPEVAGLLGFVLLTDARRGGRLADGSLVLLEDQDRSLWDRAEIEEGAGLVRESLATEPPSVYALLGAIAETHDLAASWDETDWERIVACYERLLPRWPSPVVSLNRAAAIGFARGPDAGLAALDELVEEPRLATYPYLAMARATFSRRAGDLGAARTFYEEALLLTDNEVERAHIARCLDELGA